MTSTKTVLFEEAETVLSRKMHVPIFRIPETKISLPYEEFEDESTIYNNLKLSPLGDVISDLDKKRLSTNKEPENLFRSIFDKESKEYKRRIRQSSKLCKSYICSKQFIANSDDENFWRVPINDFSSVEFGKKSCESKKEGIQNLENYSDSDDVFMKDENEENLYDGKIKITIKDKPVVESKEEILEILRRSFEAFKINAQESRRLRELKTKVQEKVAKKRLRRYFDAWRDRVSNLKALERKKKEEREMSNERKIELFINAIAEKQKELTRLQKSTSFSLTSTKSGQNQRCKSAPEEILEDSIPSKNALEKTLLRRRCESNSQTRFQVQRKIIEEQRFKLAEQNRIIEEMRLKEIERVAKKANKDTIDVAKGALAHCGRRTRRSLLHLMREQGCRDETLEPLRVPNTPDFLIRMEARAEARRERVKRSEEARLKKIEDEKRREEDVRKKEEMERKRLQQEAQKEAKRLREEREEKRIREAERVRCLNEKADKFYHRLLLRRYIFDPLLLLVNQKHKNIEKAKNHFNETLLRKVFSAWKSETDKQFKIKEELAISVYERNLLWSSFSDWRKHTLEERRKYHVASDFYDMKIQAKILKIWRLRTLENKVLEEKNEQRARDHYEKKLKMRCFQTWMRFPEISEKVKESERQKQEWRKLVQGVIPDFDPRHRGVSMDD